MTVDLATVDEVQAEYPGTLTGSERERAERLITVASVLLGQSVTIDPTDEQQKRLAMIVVSDMVVSALSNGEHRGHTSYSWRNGALAGSGTLVSASGGVRLLDWHLSILGAHVGGPRWSFPEPWKWPER